MKCFLSWVLALLVLAQTPVVLATERQIEGAEADRLLLRIKESQATLTTIIGSFSEERMIKTMPVPLVFTGKVYARPPGFLFLSYEEPIQHIMKVAGDTVLFYVADSATADQVNLQNVAEDGAPPNIFGWDPTDFKGKILETATGYMLYNPEVKAGGREIRITLDKDTLMVKALTMQEPGGDVTKIIMKDLQVNGDIPDAILNYTLPDGVTINNMGQ